LRLAAAGEQGRHCLASGSSDREAQRNSTAGAHIQDQVVSGSRQPLRQDQVSRGEVQDGNGAGKEATALDLWFRGRLVAWCVLLEVDRIKIFVPCEDDGAGQGGSGKDGVDSGCLIAEVRGTLLSDDKWQQPSYCLQVWTPPHLGEAASAGQEVKDASNTDVTEFVESYSIVKYNTPGVCHLFLMQNWNAVCSFAATKAVAMPAWMRIFEPRERTHQQASWYFERRGLRAVAHARNAPNRASAAAGDMSSLLESQVIITVLVASAHSLVLEKLRAKDNDVIGWTRIRRFLLG